jgi:hypothetical protein
MIIIRATNKLTHNTVKRTGIFHSLAIITITTCADGIMPFNSQIIAHRRENP